MHVGASGIMARPLSRRPGGVPGARGSGAAGTRSVRAGPPALCVPKCSAGSPPPRAALASMPSPGIVTFQVQASATFSSRGRGEVSWREGAFDILCRGVGSVKNVTKKYSKHWIYSRVFGGVEIHGGSGSVDLGGCHSGVDGSLGRERVLLCSCGKTIPALECKPRVLEMELDLQRCKTSVDLCLPGFPRCARWSWSVVWFFPGGI